MEKAIQEKQQKIVQAEGEAEAATLISFTINITMGVGAFLVPTSFLQLLEQMLYLLWVGTCKRLLADIMECITNIYLIFVF